MRAGGDVRGDAAEDDHGQRGTKALPLPRLIELCPAREFRPGRPERHAARAACVTADARSSSAGRILAHVGADQHVPLVRSRDRRRRDVEATRARRSRWRGPRAHCGRCRPRRPSGTLLSCRKLPGGEVDRLQAPVLHLRRHDRIGPELLRSDAVLRQDDSGVAHAAQGDSERNARDDERR